MTKHYNSAKMTIAEKVKNHIRDSKALQDVSINEMGIEDLKTLVKILFRVASFTDLSHDLTPNDVKEVIQQDLMSLHEVSEFLDSNKSLYDLTK